MSYISYVSLDTIVLFLSHVSMALTSIHLISSSLNAKERVVFLFVRNFIFTRHSNIRVAATKLNRQRGGGVVNKIVMKYDLLTAKMICNLR